MITGLRARGVDVPLRRPFATGGGEVRTAPLVLIDLEVAGGITGRAYLFTYTAVALRATVALLEDLGALLKSHSAAPLEIAATLDRRFRLLGMQGLTAMAAAGIDMAAWDAAAKSAGVPLVGLLGGEPKALPAYNSCGLGLAGAKAAAAQTPELLEGGFRALKVRLGYRAAEEDAEALRAIREAAGPDVALMTDYNQSLDAAEAARRIRLLEPCAPAWVEEPVLATDLKGHAAVRAASKIPIQTGENWWGLPDMEKAIAAGASDHVMIDAMKIGGVTGWLRAAGLAAAHGLPLSSHLFPEISAHLLAVTPTRHWLEYIDLAAPVLREPVEVREGSVTAPERPGVGIEWDEAAVARYR